MNRETAMHQDVEVGDYLLTINVEPQYEPPDVEEIMGYSARVIVTRHEERRFEGQRTRKIPAI